MEHDEDAAEVAYTNADDDVDAYDAVGRAQVTAIIALTFGDFPSSLGLMADCGPSATRDEGESGCAFPAARPSADPHSSAAAASLKPVDGQITVLLQCHSCCMCSRQWPLVAGAASDAWAWHWPTAPLDAGENEERTFIESNGHGPQAEPHAVHVLADGAFSGLLEQSKAFLALDAKLRQLQDDVDQNKAMATLVARLEKQGKEFETSTSRRMASAEIRLAESEAKGQDMPERRPC